jgi:hypothetical protein
MTVSSTKTKRTRDYGPAPEKPQAETGIMRPFDTKELEKLPSTNDNDPPYRPWWVIDWA